MSLRSVSKIDLILEVKTKSEIKCELKRHLSPRTVGIISRSLPLKGNAHVGAGGMAYLETTISSGIERSRREFAKGDIAFLPTRGIIVFFSADSEPGRAMSLIGRVTDGADKLAGIRPGDVLCLYRSAQ